MKNPKVQKICPECGKTFLAHPNKRFCSPTCLNGAKHTRAQNSRLILQSDTHLPLRPTSIHTHPFR